MDSGACVDPSALSSEAAAPSFDTQSSFDDPAVDMADTLENDPLFGTDWDQQASPNYDGDLYPAPLSWDPPEPPNTDQIPPKHTYMEVDTPNTLTPAQQQQLRNIAMPEHLRYHGRNSYSPESTSSYKSLSISSIEPNGSHLKRKSSASADEDDDFSADKHPPVKKTAHNMIEKRYRTNLNDKIAALRDSVPSLRIMTKSARGEDTADDREELQGLTPAHKLNKATILSKATEYISHLEKRNKRLQEENMVQKSRLAAFETLFRSGSMGFDPRPPMANPFQYPRDYQAPSSPAVDPQGMIRVPQDIRRLRHGSSQQIYPVAQEQPQQQRQQANPNGWSNGRSYYGKLMVGSLAGLMIMEGFHEPEQRSDSPTGRGLFSLPVQMLRSLSQAIYSSADFSILGYNVPATDSLAYMKLFLVIGSLLYVFLPSIFATGHKSENSKGQNASLAAVPSLASSIQVRRQAWLTAIQTVWVPRHNFFLEATALCLKMVKLSMRNIIGPGGYAYITGVTPEEEAARVKAWEIALDAQLAGGDVDVSKSRLMLTLLASGTLPNTPTRLMLQALHIRVLLWEVGNAGFNGYYMFHEIAAKLARWKWNEAKQLKRLMTHTRNKEEAEFPKYLTALLEQECNDVLSDSISQRAYNLAWNLPTTHNARGPSDGMDGVVDDFTIRSPLDGIAAWYSSLVLQQSLANSLDSKNHDPDAQNAIIADVTLAIGVAPIGSQAQVRALVTRALLVKEKRGANIASALQALGPFDPKSENTASPTLINTRPSIASLPDIKMSLQCAMAIAHLERFPPPKNPIAAHRIIQNIVPANLTLLGFTAAFNLIERISEHEQVAMSCCSELEKLAGNLRIWIGGPNSVNSGLDNATKRKIVDRCLSITKRMVGMEDDAGYESMVEEYIEKSC